MSSEINNRPEIDLDAVMRRLAILSKKEKHKDILDWLGVSPSSYTNWKHRGTIPYKAIVEALLQHGWSLDSFFSPDAPLRVSDELVLRESGKYAHANDAQANAEREQLMKASRTAHAIFTQFEIPENDEGFNFLVDLWLIDQGETLSKSSFQSTIAAHLKRFLTA